MILGAAVMGLADGPTEVHKVTVARQVLRDYQAERRPLADRADPEEAGRGQGEVRRVPRARSGEPVIDIDRLAAWMDEHRPAGQGRADRAPLHLGRVAERDLRDPPRRAARRDADPAADRARRRATTGILREWRIIEALDGTDVPHTPAIAHVRRHVGARPRLLPDGLRRRLVADGHATTGRRRSTPTSTRAPGSPTSSSRASRCCRRSTGRPRACRTSAAPTASTSARSTAGPRSSSGSRAASCPGFDVASAWLPDAPPDRLRPRVSCTATTSSPT